MLVCLGLKVKPGLTQFIIPGGDPNKLIRPNQPEPTSNWQRYDVPRKSECRFPCQEWDRPPLPANSRSRDSLMSPCVNKVAKRTRGTSYISKSKSLITYRGETTRRGKSEGWFLCQEVAAIF